MKQKVVHLSRLAVLGCLMILLGGAPAFAQKGITVKGTVIDTEGLPVIGAGVTIKGTTTGAAADMDGKFTLTVPAESSVLEVVALGYSTEEITVGKQRNITVVLRDDTQTIEATVVVAYSTQTKATVTGAVTAIDNKALVKAPVADVTNVLAGQMPGVATVQETGQGCRLHGRVRCARRKRRRYRDNQARRCRQAQDFGEFHNRCPAASVIHYAGFQLRFCPLLQRVPAQ